MVRLEIRYVMNMKLPEVLTPPSIYLWGPSPRCPLQSHSLVSIENHLFIVGIGTIINREIEFIFRSERSDCKNVYS